MPRTVATFPLAIVCSTRRTSHTDSVLATPASRSFRLTAASWTRTVTGTSRWRDWQERADIPLGNRSPNNPQGGVGQKLSPTWQERTISFLPLIESASEKLVRF